MSIPEKKKIMQFLSEQKHIADSTTICVLVQKEFGIDLNIGQGHILYAQLNRPEKVA